jgi:hypothetical protein
MCFIAPHKTRWDETKKSTEVGAQIVIPLLERSSPQENLEKLPQNPKWSVGTASGLAVGTARYLY